MKIEKLKLYRDGGSASWIINGVFYSYEVGTHIIQRNGQTIGKTELKNFIRDLDKNIEKNRDYELLRPRLLHSYTQLFNDNYKKGNLLIIGPGDHGKDTVAEIIKKETGLTYSSSSNFAGELFLYDMLKEKYHYTSYDEFYADRKNKRDEWFELITAYNTPDKLKLTKELLLEYDIYVGMRNLEEFFASCHLFDLVIYVDASERIKTIDKTLQIDKKYADIIIENNDTLQDFERKVINLCKFIKHGEESKWKTHRNS